MYAVKKALEYFHPLFHPWFGIIQSGLCGCLADRSL